MPYRVTLDDEVMNKIHEAAEPWVDSPNSALRKTFDLNGGPSDELYFEVERVADSSSTGPGQAQPSGRSHEARAISRARASKPRNRSRAPRGALLDERAYWRPILETLEDAPDGAMPARDVVARVGAKLDVKFQPLDKELLNSGGLRWHTRAMFARLRMKEAGLLKADSPRGIWEISDRGRQALHDDSILSGAVDSSSHEGGER